MILISGLHKANEGLNQNKKSTPKECHKKVFLYAFLIGVANREIG